MMDKSKKYLSFFLIWATTQFSLCNCAKILGIFPIPFREHQIIYRPLIENLVRRGHELMLLTTDPIMEPLENITQIDLSFAYSLKILENLKDTTLSGSEMLKTIFAAMRQISDEELKSNAIQELLNSDMKFDAVIVEWSGASVMNGFAYKFDAPLIGISSGGALINSHEALGNPTHPIAYPNVLLPFSEDLNLLQRIASVVFTFWYRYLYFSTELPLQNELSRRYFGDEIPDLWDIETNADLLLINSYQSLGNIRPHVPSTVYLGGIHASPLGKLPKDLSLFLDSSITGAVYINVGTSQTECMSERRFDKILSTAEQLKLDIVWNCDIPKPVNSTIRVYYAPDKYQEDILLHGKTVLFITTGGQRNIEDAIHHTVPVLGISLSSHVEHYLRQIEKYSAGNISFIDYETTEEFTSLVRDIIENDDYKQNIEQLKTMVLDKPLSSIETAIWWIEYTIRHKGTNHLDSPMRKLTWFKYFMFDVLITIVCIITIVTLIIIYLINRMVQYSKSLPIEMVTRGSKCKVL